MERPGDLGSVASSAFFPLVYDTAAGPEAEWRFSFGRGLAYDAEGELVFISESAADRVRRFPLSDFALR
ncbi:MAG: hypothetical protein IH864_02800 [Chloroflexi bacterium]|nr:hypothetical protein [Chloroflexota bacterium]